MRRARPALCKQPTRLLAPALLLALPLMLMSLPAGATNFEISRLAAQLHHASAQLAIQLRNVRGYSSVSFSANKLSDEAEQLVNAVSRQRSSSYLRSEFNDLARRYHDLEKTFLRAQRGEHSPYLYQQVDRISYLFSSLDAQFYYHESYDRHAYRHGYPQAGIPRGLRPPRAGVQTHIERRDRRDYGHITATRPMQFDHGSAVLERQSRQDNNRVRIDTRQRGHSSAVETRRSNHWD